MQSSLSHKIFLILSLLLRRVNIRYPREHRRRNYYYQIENCWNRRPVFTLTEVSTSLAGNFFLEFLESMSSKSIETWLFLEKSIETWLFLELRPPQICAYVLSHRETGRQKNVSGSKLFYPFIPPISFKDEFMTVLTTCACLVSRQNTEGSFKDSQKSIFLCACYAT